MPELPTTKAGIEALPLPAKNAVDYRDTKQRALFLRVSPAGTKSWCVRDDRDGRSRRIGIGRFPDLPISLARDAASKMLTEIAGGGDPKADRRAQQAASAKRLRETVASVGDVYVEKAKDGRHRLKGKPMAPGSLDIEKRYLSVLKPRLGGQPLADLTRFEIQEAIDDIENEMSPSAARHARNVLQRIYAYAMWQDIVATDPTRFVSAPDWKERERVLTDDEMRALWSGLSDAAQIEDVHISPAMTIAIKLAAVTLQRRSEIVGMGLDEIDRSAKTWTIPGERTKNDRTHVVPLSDLALSLIDEARALRRKGAHNSPFLFPSSRDALAPVGPMALTHAWRRLRPHLAVPDPTSEDPKRTKPVENVTPHDLRRTGATNLTGERVGISRFIVSKVLNHTSDTGDSAAVTAVYDRNAYMPEKRRAMDAWASLLLEIVDGKARPDNVEELAKHRA